MLDKRARDGGGEWRLIYDCHASGRRKAEGRLIYGNDRPVIVHPQPFGEELIKVEITHERDGEEGKYFLALSVGDKVVGRVDADSMLFDNLQVVSFLPPRRALRGEGLAVFDKP